MNRQIYFHLVSFHFSLDLVSSWFLQNDDSPPQHLYFPTFVLFSTCSKASLTCCRGASAQNRDSRWRWCIRGHMVCLLSLKISRLMLKILYSILNSSQNLPPANLCYHPTSSDLLSLRLSDDSRTSSLSQPPKLSQLHKRLSGLGAPFQPFFHGLFALWGEKHQLDICFLLPS